MRQISVSQGAGSVTAPLSLLEYAMVLHAARARPTPSNEARLKGLFPPVLRDAIRAGHDAAFDSIPEFAVRQPIEDAARQKDNWPQVSGDTGNPFGPFNWVRPEWVESTSR